MAIYGVQKELEEMEEKISKYENPDLSDIEQALEDSGYTIEKSMAVENLYHADHDRRSRLEPIEQLLEVHRDREDQIRVRKELENGELRGFSIKKEQGDLYATILTNW